MAKIKPVINKEWFNESASSSYCIEMRPYTLKELYVMYGLRYKAMVKAMSPFVHLVGEKPGRYYSVRQLEIILTHLGPPYTLRENP